MTRRPGQWVRLLVLSVLALTLGVAHADPTTTSYVVKGPMGAALWGLGDRPGTEALVFAFDELAPEKGEAPAPGPRVTFSVSQWELGYTGWVRRQWFGDVALETEAFKVGAELTDGVLEATVMGTLEERSQTGASLYREVPGKLQIRWTGRSNIGNSTLAYVYQTPAYTATLKSQGMGRAATATATLTVDALGGSIGFWGFGSLFNVSSGSLAVTMP